MAENYTILSFTEKCPLRCTMRHIGNIEPHVQDIFEIDMILSGRCQARVGEQVFSLQATDVLSVEAHIPHSFFGTDCTIITVQFDQLYFERSLPNPRHPDFLCNSAITGDSAAYDSLRRQIARLVKNNAEAHVGFELRNFSIIYDIMDVMYQNFRVEDSEARNQRAHRYTLRMAEISRIINESYREDLTLGELASRVHLSAPYLSKFFEKQFGVTFLNYLTGVRLNHAVDELLKTNDTIETVSANAGFPNSHAFVQAFKREYGLLPSVYRRKNAGKKPAETNSLPLEQHDYMAGLKKYLEQPLSPQSAAQARACRASVSAREASGTLHHSWRELAGVSSASALLLSDVQALLRRVQRDVGFRSIKFNGILSEDMHVYSENSDGEPIYSFAFVDKAFDFLQELGLRPFVQLGFMPEAMAKTHKRLFGYLVSEPTSLEKWGALVTALIRHLQERYGRQALRSWRFSVWHLPDTSDAMYGFSSDEAFYAFYRETYLAVKHCDSTLSFGAPSTYYMLQDGYENWYLTFWRWCRENDCLPDFFNFHYYDLVLDGRDSGQEAFGFTRAMSLRNNPDGFSRFVTQVLNERRSLSAEDRLIYLTEWNNTPSQQDLLNDTCFKSCYIVKGILENYDRLDSFGYWSLTDWMGEAPQPKELFFGGLGLFTTNGIPKASYYAFMLLKQLGDALLGRGDGWFITRQGDSFRILLYNYRHFSHLYALGERFDMTFTDRYTPFSPEQMLDVHLSLRDVENGEYIVTETILNRSSGSAFDTWVSMGAVELTRKAELENLAARSVPAINKYTVTAENSTLRLDAMLDMLEVRLIVVSRI